MMKSKKLIWAINFLSPWMALQRHIRGEGTLKKQAETLLAFKARREFYF